MGEQLLDFIRSLKLDKSIGTYDEAATKQAIILRCLHILGWNTFNIDEVHPEYSVGRDRVDYSLRIDRVNKVFLEVKRVGEDLEKENHQKQLLNYSFQQGVRLAILSNGVTWWFYLPLHEGNWEQRKFYSIDIYQQVAEDIASKFIDFLSKENIAGGKAFENAESAYRSQQRRKVLQENLPKAWNMIISEPDELLVELINETTEKICGYRADDDAIRRFLSGHREGFLVPAILVPEPPPKPPPSPEPDSYTGKKISSFYFRGQDHEVSSWKNLLTELCRIMNTMHKTGFDKVLELRGRKNPHFTRDRNQLTEPVAIPGTDIFVETCWSANQTVRFCRRLIALFGYSEDDLKIELKPD